MPKMMENESMADFMKRCVPMMKKEGKKTSQAVAMCVNMHKEEQNKKK